MHLHCPEALGYVKTQGLGNQATENCLVDLQMEEPFQGHVQAVTSPWGPQSIEFRLF